MSFYDAIRVGSSGDSGGYEVERSLRFYDLASNYLQNTTGRTENTGAYTISFWVKLGTLSSNIVHIFTGMLPNGLNSSFAAVVYYNNKFYYYHYSGADNDAAQTDGVIRDPSAWYHVLASKPVGSVGTLYLNGVAQSNQTGNASNEVDIFSGRLTVGANYNSSQGFYRYFNGYIAEMNVIDGTALTPSSFTETNSTTGQLNPKKYTGSYGSRGFYLNFSDNSDTTATTLGKDYSGNGENFTTNGFSVAVGSAVNIKNNDSVLDTPTNNFPVLNPLNFNPFGVSNYVASSPVNGNLGWLTNTTSNVNYAESTMVFPNTGKWYLEVYVNNLNIGSSVGYTQITVYGDTGGSRYLWWVYSSPYYQIATNSTTETIGSISNGDIIQVAYDSDTGNVWFGKNNTWYLSGDPANGTAMSPATTVANDYAKLYVAGRSGSAQNTLNVNFGQQGFLYTPPTGFKAISSKNIPDPTILLPNKHFNTLLYTGNDTTQSITGLEFQPDWVWIKARNTSLLSHGFFDAVRGINKSVFSNSTSAENTGEVFTSFDSNGFSVSDAGGNWTNDSYNYVAWNWNAGGSASKTYRVVVVSDSGNKYRFRNSANSATFAQSAVTLDLEEGGTYTFDGSDSTMASHPIKLSTTANGTHGGGSSYNTGVTYELDGSTVTESAYVSGYSSATSRKLIITVAASAPQLFYYCHVHSGMGGAINTNSTLGSSNFDGSIQTTVKANTTAGFSIVTYTGNGTGGATIGHGLGVAPDVLIVKNRGPGARIWLVYHSANTSEPATEYLQLDATAATADDNSAWNDTAPTSTVFSVGTSASSNNNSEGHVAYCFSEVAGYSKFGSYTANGSTDGAFVYTGFRPAWVLIKRSDSSGNWFIIDNKRDTFNEVTKDLKPNTSGSETDNPNFLDFLSNGFKLRTAGASVNSGTMIYLAFAESPFKNNRAR